MKNYKVRYELDETGWWVASIDAVPGCHTQGRTIEQRESESAKRWPLLVGDKHAASAKLEDDVELPKAAKRSVYLAFIKREEASRVAAEAENPSKIRSARVSAR